MVEHVNTHLMPICVYNAEHAQLYADAKNSAKGPLPKSGHFHALVKRISELILKKHYSPYAVLQVFDKEKLWPPGFRICEKTLCN